MKSLGLEEPLFEPKEKLKKKAVPRKRKIVDEDTECPEAPAKKLQREDSSESETVTAGLRRSSRQAGKKVDYLGERKMDSPQPIIRERTSGNDGPMGREDGKRVHDP